ncbi:MAG: ATP-binding protein [Magnetospirillum sp.]
MRIRARRALLFAPLLLILVLLALQSWSAYEGAKREAHITVTNLADVLTHTIDNTLVRIYADLGTFATLLNAKTREGRPEFVSVVMEQSLRNFDAVLNYRVIDSDGNGVLGVGRAAPEAKLNVSDRHWFQVLRQNPERDFELSEVLISRVSGKAGIVLARPLRDRQQRFTGAVIAYIDLEWLQRLIEQLNIGEQGLVTLRLREKAKLVLRRPQVVEQLNESNTGLYALYQSSVTRAEGEFVSAIDHLKRLYAFRNLPHFPLAVVVALNTDDYLLTWYSQALMTGVLALILTAIQVTVYRRLNGAYGDTVAMATELQRSNLNLERSNAELEEFAYISSHDLQTPLRNIASFSQLLARRYDGQLDQEGREFINFIVTNATRMSGLIQDLLAYARVSRAENAPPLIEAEDVLEQVLADLKPQISAANARVQHGPLPPVATSPHQLSSLFANLIENALKYHHPDRPPEITISAEPGEEGFWHFQVKDNGIGIAREHWEQIFAIFQRLHSIDAYPGNGVGLALCRRMVYRWGGTIWVESIPDQGSTFHFTAPT